jgi:hypothetical protein
MKEKARTASFEREKEEARTDSAAEPDPWINGMMKTRI